MHALEETTGNLGTLDAGIEPTQKFREFLATRGKRLTQERATLVEEVFAMHEHFDADQMVARLANRKDGRPSVSRSTVYRRLQELVEAGLIRRVARAHGREVYEHDYGYPQHDHFICSKCHKMIEFRNTEIRRHLEAIAREHGFALTGHRLEAEGLCIECAKPRRHRKLDMI